jgi:hypothetical protein
LLHPSSLVLPQKVAFSLQFRPFPTVGACSLRLWFMCGSGASAHSPWQTGMVPTMGAKGLWSNSNE